MALRKELYKMFGEQRDDILYVRRKLAKANRLNREKGPDNYMYQADDQHAISDEQASEYKDFLAESYGSALKSATQILRTEVALSKDDKLIKSLQIRVADDAEADEADEIKEKKAAALAQKLMSEVIN